MNKVNQEKVKAIQKMTNPFSSGAVILSQEEKELRDSRSWYIRVGIHVAPVLGYKYKIGEPRPEEGFVYSLVHEDGEHVFIGKIISKKK